MAKKKIVSKKVKLSNSMTEIQKVKACIAKDQVMLEKLYKKAISDTSKKLVGTAKLLAKAKKAVDQTAKNKKKSPKNHTVAVSLFQSLKTELITIKAEQSCLNMGYKKLNMQQKALGQIDKILAKSVKTPAKQKRKAVKKTSMQNKTKETGANVAVLPDSITTV